MDLVVHRSDIRVFYFPCPAADLSFKSQELPRDSSHKQLHRLPMSKTKHKAQNSAKKKAFTSRGVVFYTADEGTKDASDRTKSYIMLILLCFHI